MLGFSDLADYISPMLYSGAGMLKRQKPGLDFLFKRHQLPYIGEANLTNLITDKDLKKLEYAMIKDTYVHRHECFWNDNVATSFANIMISFIVGEGIKVAVKDDEEAEKIIQRWNDEINVKHQTVEDLIGDIWLDNLIDGRSLWRIFIDNKDEEHKVDLQRVSMRSVKIDIHPTQGWRRFIQTHSVPKKIRTKNSFYASDTLTMLDVKPIQTVIPDEPTLAFYVSFFKKAPVSTVLQPMVNKRWTFWFIRKFSEKFWAPFLIGYIGDPESGYMPMKREDIKDSLNFTVDALRKIRSFGVGAFMGTTKVDVLDTKTGQHSDIYVNYIDMYNKQIIHGLYGFIGIRETGQREYGRDMVMQGLLRFVRGLREKIAIKLRGLYTKVVLPAYGKERKDTTDVNIIFPGINTENIRDVAYAIETAAKLGAFTDVTEIRRILNPLWKHIDENLDQAQIDEAKRIFLELSAPSRKEEDKPQDRAKGKGETEKLRKEWM